MSKGKKLGQLLDEAETLHNQMKALFLKNGLTMPILKNLPDQDKTEWLRLKAESDTLFDQIANLINNT